MVTSKSAVARRVPVAPAAPPRVDPSQVVRERTPLPWSFEAYAEFDEEVQQEKLTLAQRRVPRGNALARGPQPTQPIVPRYPVQMLSRGIRGSVLLEAFIGAGGAVDDIVVIDDEGKPGLAVAAVQAVRGTSFTPAEGPRGATPSRMTLRFLFTFE
jgi:TonB family protein